MQMCVLPVQAWATTLNPKTPKPLSLKPPVLPVRPGPPHRLSVCVCCICVLLCCAALAASSTECMCACAAACVAVPCVLGCVCVRCCVCCCAVCAHRHVLLCVLRYAVCRPGPHHPAGVCCCVLCCV